MVRGWSTSVQRAVLLFIILDRFLCAPLLSGLYNEGMKDKRLLLLNILLLLLKNVIMCHCQ